MSHPFHPYEPITSVTSGTGAWPFQPAPTTPPPTATRERMLSALYGALAATMACSITAGLGVACVSHLTHLDRSVALGPRAFAARPSLMNRAQQLPPRVSSCGEENLPMPAQLVRVTGSQSNDPYTLERQALALRDVGVDLAIHRVLVAPEFAGRAIETLTDRSEVAPVHVRGALYGLRITRLQPGAAWAQLGFQPNDILTAINGCALGRTEQLCEGHSLDGTFIELLRDGRRVVLRTLNTAH